MSLELILSLLDQVRVPSEVVPTVAGLYSVYSKEPLGRLIKLLRSRVSVSDDEAAELDAALQSRNYLVHGFFKSEDRLIATMTSAGISNLIGDIGKLRAKISGANRITDRLLDELLKKYGFTVAALKEHAQDMLETARLADVTGALH